MSKSLAKSSAQVQALPDGAIQAFVHKCVTIYRSETFQLFSTSKHVAEKFGKNHHNVIQKIETMKCSPEFRALNFKAATYLDEQGKPRPMFNLTRDGFSILVMGFTTDKAMVWKEKFLAAFNAMEAELLRQDKRERRQDDRQLRIECLQARIEGKVVRLFETDHIKTFVGYAVGQGSKSAKFYYANLTTMTYKALGFVELGLGENLREKLNIVQHQHLMAAESIVAFALQEGMEQGLHYKAIYQVAKERVVAFAKAMPPATFFDRLNVVALRPAPTPSLPLPPADAQLGLFGDTP